MLQSCRFTRWVAKHDPNKDHTKRHGNVEEECSWGLKPRQSQLRKAESRLNSFPWGRGSQLVIPYRMVSPESVHTSNSVRTAQMIFFYLGTHRETYNNNWKEHRVWVWKRVRDIWEDRMGEQGRGQMMSSCYNLKKQKIVIKKNVCGWYPADISVLGYSIDTMKLPCFVYQWVVRTVHDSQLSSPEDYALSEDRSHFCCLVL